MDSTTSDVVIVAASRSEARIFERSTFLGRSLSHFPARLRPELQLHAANSGATARGLADVYNESIEMAPPDATLVFVHDDVFIHDWFLADRLAEALDRFDVVGLAGSIDPDLTQPSWGLAFTEALVPEGWQVGLERSGTVNHFDYGSPEPSFYGPAARSCELLDGLFLAVRARTLHDSNVRFDPQFDFHMYDIDFCRTARQAGLRLGTWPIAVTHDSGGEYETEAFRESARRYLAKWA